MTGGFEVLAVRANPWPTGSGAGTPAAPGVPSSEGRPSSLAGEHVVPGSKTRTAGEAVQGLQPVIEARATVPGVARIRGIEITYRVGPRQYRHSSDPSIFLCAPLERYTAENCPGDAERRFDNVVMDFPVAR